MNYIDDFLSGNCGMLIQQSNVFDVFELEDKIKQYGIKPLTGQSLSEYWMEHIESETEYDFIFVNKTHNCYDAAKALRFIDYGPKLSADKIIGYSVATFTINENDFDCVLMGD